MSIDVIFAEMKAKAESADALGGTLKFMIDESIIFINGHGESNDVSQEDDEAECTVTTSSVVLQQLSAGDLNPMMAVMGGQVKIKGDMGLAMKIQSLLG
jgi:putative sterol carrier protein